MRRFTPAKATMALAAALCFAPAAGVQARPRKPPEVEAPPPPPPPPPAGPVGLPERLIDEAAAYQAYMQRVAGATPGFTSADTVSHVLRDAAAYEPKAFIRSAIAYAAIAALKDPTFVAGLREAGNTPEHRQQMVTSIATNPIYVFQFRGADAAAGYAQAALAQTALRLNDIGRQVRQAAYDVQHQDWSKSYVADPPGRLAAVQAEEAAGVLTPGPDAVPVLQRAASEAEPLPISAAPLAPPYAPLVAHALQVAAIAALGEANDAAYDELSAISTDLETTLCLERAKRDLYQCLAVSRPNYEDIFCMGRHEMLQPAACMADGAGVQLPPEPVPPPPPPKPTRLASHRRTAAHHKTHTS